MENTNDKTLKIKIKTGTSCPACGTMFVCVAIHWTKTHSRYIAPDEPGGDTRHLTRKWVDFSQYFVENLLSPDLKKEREALVAAARARADYDWSVVKRRGEVDTEIQRLIKAAWDEI